MEQQGKDFLPFIVGTLGGFGAGAEKVIEKIARAMSYTQRITVDKASHWIKSTIGFLVQKINATKLLRLMIMAEG